MPLVLWKLGWIVLYFVAATLLSRLAPRVVEPLVRSRAWFTRRRRWSERRMSTIIALVNDLVKAGLYLLASILSLSLFVDSTGLFTFLGLFSAAFGLGARPLFSDYFSGIVFLFEDLYAIGEKVEINGVEGTVEAINLRTTYLRGVAGELHIIPNGEIRNVRNFARGTFSLGSIQVEIRSSQLDTALDVLRDLVQRLPQEFPDLIEPPHIVVEDGLLGVRTRLTIVAKTQYGKGAEVRRQLLERVQEALAHAGVELGE